jgi:hypothetical protein
LLYVYGLLDAEPSRLPDGGIEGLAVRLQACGGLFAAVSEIPEPPEIREQFLREHEQTVRLITDCVNAILPARFGSIVADEETLRTLLREREAELRRSLAMVAGCEQMTLRVFTNTPGEIPATTIFPTEGLGPGARYLASKVREVSVPGLDAIRPELSSFVRAEQIQRHNAPPLLASVYHLIERGGSAAYLSVLKRTSEAASLPVRFTASGPWPPYAFGRWENG